MLMTKLSQTVISVTDNAQTCILVSFSTSVYGYNDIIQILKQPIKNKHNFLVSIIIC